MDEPPPLKRHNIVIERWAGNPGPSDQRGKPGFRWTVTYEKDGIFQVQGFEDTHAEARAAAEACLVERGIDINWLGPRESQKRASPKPRWTKPKL